MRHLPILALLIAATALAAEDAPQRQLDPTKPADAVVIVDLLTQDLALPRRQADAFRAALETLARHVAEHPPQPATPPPAESAPAKKD